MELVALLAKYFKGGLPARDLLDMSLREIKIWYKLYERQVIEQEIRNKYHYPASGKPIPLPSPEYLRKMVDNEIKKRRIQNV
jgi:hypothetical protein